MKKLFALLVVITLFTPLPAAANCHSSVTFTATPERVASDQQITFQTRFIMSPDADFPCNANNLKFIVRSMHGGDEDLEPVRSRNFTRAEILRQMRERPDHAFAWDFSKPVAGEGRTDFYVDVRGGAAADSPIVWTKETPVTIFITGPAREQSALEQSGNGAPQGGPVPLQVRIGDYARAASLPQYLATVFNYAIRLAPLLAMIMIVIGGMQWLLAAGATDKISEAKKRISSAVIGLVLALSAFLLLQTVNPAIVQFKELQIPKVGALDISACPPGTLGCPCRETVGDAPACGPTLSCVSARYVLATDDNAVFMHALAGGLAGAGLGFLGTGGVGATAGANQSVAYGGYVSQEEAVANLTLRERAVAGLRGAGSGVGFAVMFAGFGVGAAATAIYDMGTTQELCTDGKPGSPCDTDASCESGKCYEYTHTCFNPPSPPGGICNGGGDCGGGSSCQEVEGPAFLGVFSENNPKFCRGSLDKGGVCSVNAECKSGLVCVVPAGLLKGKCGYLKTSTVASPDDYLRNPCVIGGTLASGCAPRGEGADRPTSCVFCPSTSPRNWITLTIGTENFDRIIGQCHKPADIGTACSH